MTSNVQWCNEIVHFRNVLTTKTGKHWSNIKVHETRIWSLQKTSELRFRCVEGKRAYIKQDQPGGTRTW